MSMVTSPEVNAHYLDLVPQSDLSSFQKWQGSADWCRTPHEEILPMSRHLDHSLYKQYLGKESSLFCDTSASTVRIA